MHTDVLVKYLLRGFKKVAILGERVEAYKSIQLHCFECCFLLKKLC